MSDHARRAQERGGDAGVGSRAAKAALFDALASVAQALASGRRAEIVELLAQGQRSVEQVAEAIGHSVANTSHHLRVLSRAGLVTRRREGTRAMYALASHDVDELWTVLRQVAAERVADIDDLANAYLGDQSDLEPVSREELLDRLEDPLLVVFDVRPELEFRAGHIDGARPVPLAQLQQLLAAVPKDAEVVAYCRGPYCMYADEAVRQLRRHGYRARRLQDGFPEWRRAGLPVEPPNERPQAG